MTNINTSLNCSINQVSGVSAKTNSKSVNLDNDKETKLSFMGDELDEPVILDESENICYAPYNPNPAWQALRFMAEFVGGRATGLVGMLFHSTPAYGGTTENQHKFKNGGGVR